MENRPDQASRPSRPQKKPPAMRRKALVPEVGPARGVGGQGLLAPPSPGSPEPKSKPRAGRRRGAGLLPVNWFSWLSFFSSPGPPGPAGRCPAAGRWGAMGTVATVKLSNPMAGIGTNRASRHHILKVNAADALRTKDTEVNDIVRGTVTIDNVRYQKICRGGIGVGKVDVQLLEKSPIPVP